MIISWPTDTMVNAGYHTWDTVFTYDTQGSAGELEATLNAVDLANIAAAVWNKLTDDHKQNGSFGQAVNELKWRSR